MEPQPQQSPPDQPPGPLSGYLVVDLSRALAGPHAGMMLGDLGARVIKIENPQGGDETRGWGPPYVEPQGVGGPGAEADGAAGPERVATYFLSCNRNKQSVALDLKDAADLRVLEALVARADVLVENFRPGVLDRLGLSTSRLEELNPQLVVLSISGFGHDGPEGGRPGYDQIAQGEGGLMSLTGSGPEDPQRVGVPIGDLLAGMYGAYGVLAALLERERTGRGQVVRTSLLAAIVGVHAFQGTRWTVAGQLPAAQGNHHPSLAPYGLFGCADGAVQVACGNESLWRRFCAAFGLDPAAEGMASNAERVANRPQLIELLEGAFASSTMEQVLARLAEAGVPGGRVRDLRQVYEWEQTRSQGLLVDVEHPGYGRVSLPGPPLRFFRPGGDGTGEVETTFTRHTAPPALDEDGARVRRWLAEG